MIAHQEVAVACWTRRALPRQAYRLPFGDARWNLHLQALCLPVLSLELQRACGAVVGVGEWNIEAGFQVFSLGRGRSMCPAARARHPTDAAHPARAPSAAG